MYYYTLATDKANVFGGISMKKRVLLSAVIATMCIMTACGSKETAKNEGETPVKNEKVTEEKQTEKQTEKETVAQKKVKIETLEIEANGRKIYGKIYMPDDTEKHPAIIMGHGYNGTHKDFLKECAFYAKNGYVAYTFDFCGGSGASKSTGASTDMTIFTEKEDMVAVFDYISAMENVDSEKVCMFGGSQGGLVAALAAEERADKVNSVALYFPAFNIPDNWRGNFKTESEIPEVVDFWGLKLGKKFFTEMRDFYPFENIGKFTKNVLIIQGDKDDIVPLSVAQKAKTTYKSAELVVLPGEGHGFKPSAGKQAMDLVLEFMNKQ